MVAGPAFDAAVQDECVDTCVCACTSMCAHVHEHVRIHVCRRVFLRAVCILTVHEIAVECSHRVSSERQVNDRDERQRLFKNLFYVASTVIWAYCCWFASGRQKKNDDRVRHYSELSLPYRQVQPAARHRLPLQ